jgi:hypothetical protein
MRLVRLLIPAFAGCLIAAIPAPADDKKSDDGWVSLFNGKDLTGWKIPDPPSGQFDKLTPITDGGHVVGYKATEKRGGKEWTLWQVKDGLLVGGGPMSHIYTEKEFTNFRFRVECKVNDKGNSGQFFRAGFRPGVPKGYEAQLNATHADPIKTGSLYPNPEFKLDKFRKDIVTVLNTAPHGPDEFFTQEVVADGNHIQIFVNGKQTLDWKDPNNTFTRGHFALQGHDPGSVMTFRKVEVKEIK